MARIAHAGFLHETNTFAPLRATWDDFLRTESFPGLTEGSAVIDRLIDVNIGTGGFIQQARLLGHELLPIAWAAAVPCAHVTEDAFERMSALILDGLDVLRNVDGGIDGVYLDLHGAMVTEHLEDGEGELIRRVRAAVGDDMPVVVSLDLHSNTTAAMMEQSDGLVAYRTYPHVDMADTGRRAADYMNGLLRGARPAKARRALPFLMPLTGQCTTLQPCSGVYEYLELLERADDVQLISFTPGFPPADIHDCGPAIVAYGSDQSAADAAADDLLEYILAREELFAVPFLSTSAAVAKAIGSNSHKPMVLADVQDNCGAGATSDTTGLLRTMLDMGASRCVLGVLVDPDVAAAAHRAGEGAEIDVTLGGKLYTDGDPPLAGRFIVTRLGDGNVRCTGPMFGGVEMQLEPMALLTQRGVGVVISTHRMQAADQALFRHVGVEPAEQKILGLKSTVHFRADFDPIAEETLVVGAPGAFIDQPEKLPYAFLRRGVRLCPMGPEN